LRPEALKNAGGVDVILGVPSAAHSG
jgi:hypothetical protein